MMMAELEVTKVAEELNHQVLYSVRLSADANRMGFPISIQDQVSSTANETAVLTSTLAFPEELEAAARLRLRSATRQTA
jgi:hypothetical protein